MENRKVPWELFDKKSSKKAVFNGNCVEILAESADSAIRKLDKELSEMGAALVAGAELGKAAPSPEGIWSFDVKIQFDSEIKDYIFQAKGQAISKVFKKD